MTDRTVGAAGAAGTFDYTCDGTDDHTEIAAAIAAAGAGYTVYLSAGTFNCAADISITAGRSLVGTAGTVLQFDETTPRSLYARGTNTVDRLELRGGVTLTVTGSDVDCSNLTSYQRLYGVAAFWIYQKVAEYPLARVTFTDCSAIDTSGFGFYIYADSYAYVVSDVTFTRCHALNCGAANDLIDPAVAKAWITGFDVAEVCTLVNCHLIDCTAEGSWESGFHSEYGPTENCTMTRCVSTRNGRVKPGALFRAGFASPPSWTFTDCVSIDNITGFRCGNVIPGPHNNEVLALLRCRVSGAWTAFDIGAAEGTTFHATADHCVIEDGIGQEFTFHVGGPITGEFTNIRVVNCAGGVYDTGGCLSTLFTYYVAPFAATPPAPVTGEAVAFTDASANDGLTAWEWDFGDGSGSAAQHPTHTFTAPGVYPVTLAAGGNTVTQTITVVPGVSIPAPVTGETVAFVDHPAGPAAWSWGFGNVRLQGSPVSRRTWTINALADDRAEIEAATALTGQHLTLNLNGVEYPGVMIRPPMLETQLTPAAWAYQVGFVQETRR